MANTGNNLVIDAGNTAIKMAVFSAEELVQHWRLERSHFHPEFEKLMAQFRPATLLLSSVAETVKELVPELPEYCNLIELSDLTRVPLTNSYKTPATLGKDRLANAVAAVHKNPGQKNLVIDAGTCLKFDFIDSENNYLGGSISPGLQMRFKALHTFTGRLPLIETGSEATLIGNDTKTSIQSGVLNGMKAEISAMTEQYQQQYGGMNIHLTGGDMHLFAKALKNPIFADPFLTLRGLNTILKHNV